MTDKPRKMRFGMFLVLAGATIAVLTWLFAMANNTWTEIMVPSPPWSTEPAVPVFEARLWAIMLVSFAVGAVIFGALSMAIAGRKQVKAKQATERVKELETELANVTKLVTATRKGTE